jgi:predicted MFS family arabinose efflux permease
VDAIQPGVISRKDHVNFIASVFCFWFATYIYVPVFGVYMQSIGFSYSAIGIILGSYGITQILLRFPLGILSDFLREYRKYLLIGGFIASLFSSLILVLFDSFFMILIARLLAGVTASMWVMATVLYSYYFSVEKSSRAMGIMQFVTVATQFLSMAISGYLVHLFGWHFPFGVGVVASLLGVLFAWNIKEVDKERVNASHFDLFAHIKRTITIPQLKMFTFLSLIAHAVLFITIFGFSPIAAAEIGVPEKSLIWLISAFFVPHAIASLSLVIYDFDRSYSKLVLALCFGLSAFFLAMVPLTNSLFSLNVLHFGIGLTLGFIFPILLSEVVKVSSAEFKMSAMGFYQSFYAIGIFFGPLAAGVVAEKVGLDGVFLSSGLLSLFAAIIVLLMTRRNI